MYHPSRGSNGWNIQMTSHTDNERASVGLNEYQSRSLFDTMLQGVVFQDVDGRIISMNPAAEHILGRSPAEFLDQTSESVEHDTLRADGSPFLGKEHPAMVALRTGQEIKDVVMGVYNPLEERIAGSVSRPCHCSCRARTSLIRPIRSSMTSLTAGGRKKRSERARSGSEAPWTT